MENQRNNNGQFLPGNKEGNRFSSENQPENPGRKGRSTTEYLRKLAEARTIRFALTITDADGKVTNKEATIESEAQLNELLANLLWADAIKGSHKARKEILDRLEGRPKQNHVLEGGDNPIQQTITYKVVQAGGDGHRD